MREYVMRRVYALFLIRSLLSPASRVLALGVSLLLITLSVSVPNVIHNMPSFLNIADVSRFFVYAFLNTQVVVQVLLVILTTFVVWTGVDIVRVFAKNSRQFDTALN